MSLILRPYQVEGEQQIFAAWREGYKNVMYQLVTGGGKTALFVDIIKKFLMKKRRVMLIAHREELITQAWTTLYKNQIFAGIIKSGVQPNYGLPCQVASIQTIYRRNTLPHADLIIIDEAHHAMEDNSYGAVLDRFYPEAWVLGVTATPYRLSGRGFTNLFDKLVRGPKFTELVDWGYLTPLEYFIAGVPDLSKAKLSKGDYREDDIEKAMGFAPLVESYGDHCRGKCGVVFGVNVRHSRNIVDQYNAAGVKSAHLDGNTRDDLRQKILKDFKERRLDIISNVGIITEGFDFPDMEFVQLARPTKSLSMYLQMIGRVTRTDYNVIKDAETNEIRRLLVSQSKKPFGIVLDNAGCYREHGLPDRDHNWQLHFDGVDKERRKRLAQLIEIVEYVAEDEDGRRVYTEIPEEVDGLKLIKVNTKIREKIINIVSLKEFDKHLEMFKRMPKIQKKGFAAYQAYASYCRKSNVLMTPEVWDYLTVKLVKDPEDLQSKLLSDRDNNLDALRKRYELNTTEIDNLTKIITEETDRKIAEIKKLSVPSGYLKKERREYEDRIARENTVFEK